MTRHIHNWFHFHVKIWDINIVEYYTHISLLQVGRSITNLYIPIYLLADLGYSIPEVFFFYFLFQLLFVPSVLVSGPIIQMCGLKKAMALALPFFALFFWAMNQMTGDFVSDMWWIGPFLFLRAFFSSIGNVANDMFMAKNVLKKAAGKMIAWIKIIMTVSTLIAPLVGGMVSYFFGFEFLFYVAIGIILVSGIPLIITPEKHFKIAYTPKSLLSFLKHKAQPDYLLAEFGNIFSDTVMWIMWPIFLFYVLENTADMGTLVTISAVASIVVSYFVGSLMKKVDPKKLIRAGVKCAGALFFARPLFLHPIIIGVIDSLYKVVDPVFRIPYDHAAYKLVLKNEHLLQRANFKQLVQELYYTFAVTILLILTYFFSSFSKEFFMLIFLVSALIMLLMQRMAHVQFNLLEKHMIEKEEDEGTVEKSVEIIKRGEF